MRVPSFSKEHHYSNYTDPDSNNKHAEHETEITQMISNEPSLLYTTVTDNDAEIAIQMKNDFVESGTLRLLDWNDSMTNIQLDMRFVENVQVISAVRKCSTSVDGEYRVVKSKSDQWTAKSYHHSDSNYCSWYICIIKKANHGRWEITRFVKEHTCLVVGLISNGLYIQAGMKNIIRVRVYSDPTLDPGRSGLDLEFYTLEDMGSGLGPSLTIRVRVWVWGYPEGLDPFTALSGTCSGNFRASFYTDNTVEQVKHFVFKFSFLVEFWVLELRNL
ncbi:hypothetical protein M9H77_18493 [Catharanthus roseus]|uniref:Uncharacterized protein n=1 Tax=Catharanthus roseus TaxID=4058 RepID=A0ACC0B7N3_CATRO|nr:hypothetical protein M9H77_18493 [Catharanthus roseus]